MPAGSQSSILPEAFRHKVSKVYVYQPQAILLDFHGTISERRWEDKTLFPYVQRALAKYLQENWTNDIVQGCIPSLRNESFEQHFRNKNDDAPLIDDNTQESEPEAARIAQQLADFLAWQRASRRQTAESHTIERLVWLEGLRSRRLATPVYDDVLASVRQWHERNRCAIYVISSIDSSTLKLLFENTTKGNLDRYVTGYLGLKRPGDKLVADTYRTFYERLGVKPRQVSPPTKLEAGREPSGARSARPSSDRAGSPVSASASVSAATAAPPASPPRAPASPTRRSSAKSAGSPELRAAKSASSLANDTIARPVLFLTDNGQEAKAASQVQEGTAFECVLVNRPGNKRLRTYYLSQFQLIDTFEDLVFV